MVPGYILAFIFTCHAVSLKVLEGKYTRNFLFLETLVFSTPMAVLFFSFLFWPGPTESFPFPSAVYIPFSS